MTHHEDQLSSRDFAQLTAFVYSETGIRLGTEKRTMLEGRLRKRLRELEIDTYRHYCDYLFGPQGQRDEKVLFIDVVTTNKTDFFREPKHFDFLTRQGLEEMAVRAGGQPLLLWSAGCSSGEEPYTLAMVLSEYAEAHPGFRFRILATDISTKVLARAEMGIYPSDVVEPVPPPLRHKYLMRSRDQHKDRVRIVPELLQVRSDASRPTVGRMNREMALEVLRGEGFDVAASQLGGPVGIHIDFYTTTGEVRLRRLR